MYLLSPETASPQRLRVAVEMLRKTTSKVGKLHRDFALPSIPKTSLTLRCIKVRQTLDALLRARGEQKASQYKFSSSDQVFARDVLFRVAVNQNVSDLLMPAGNTKARAIKNLEGFQLFGDQSCLAERDKPLLVCLFRLVL